MREINFHMRLAAIWAKRDERRKTFTRANLQTAPAIHIIGQDDGMLLWAKGSLFVPTFALVVGQFRGQVRGFVVGKRWPSGYGWVLRTASLK